MSRKIKYNLARIGIVVGVLLACAGINNMIPLGLGGQSPLTVKAVGFLVVGVLLGIVSSFMYSYLKNRPDDSLDQQKIAVETLAKLAEDMSPKSDHKTE